MYLIPMIFHTLLCTGGHQWMFREDACTHRAHSLAHGQQTDTDTRNAGWWELLVWNQRVENIEHGQKTASHCMVREALRKWCLSWHWIMGPSQPGRDLGNWFAGENKGWYKGPQLVQWRKRRGLQLQCNMQREESSERQTGGRFI